MHSRGYACLLVTRSRLHRLAGTENERCERDHTVAKPSRGTDEIILPIGGVRLHGIASSLFLVSYESTHLFRRD